MKLIISFMLLYTLILIGCDTSNNVEERFNSYFVKYYGSEGDQHGVDVKIINDGFIVLGNTVVNDRSAIFLVKTDDLGNEIWQSQFVEDYEIDAVGLEVDASGNFVIAATVGSADRNVMILKVDGGGVEIDKMIYGNEGFDDIAENILITKEGDYILTGYTNNVDTSKPGYDPITDLQDIYSIRTSSSLVQFSTADWRRVYGFPGIDRGMKILQKDDGTFLFYGTTDRPPTSNSQQGGFNMFLFPAGPDGLALSTSELQLFGTSSDESASDIISTSDGFAMIGTMQSGVNQPYLAKISSNTDFLSADIIAVDLDIEANSIIESADGGLIILGKEANNNDSNIYLIKLKPNGSIDWQKSFGGTYNDDDGRIQETENGSIIFTGTIVLESQSKICLIKITKKGELKI